MRYLNRYKTSYYFRMRIPRDLQSVVGRCEYKKSLGKISPYKAAIIAQSLAIRLQESFEGIRTNKSMSKLIQKITLSFPDGTKAEIDQDDPEEERKTLETLKGIMDSPGVRKFTESSILLSQLIEQYCAEKIREKCWEERTQSQNEAKFARLLTIVGDLSVHDIDHETARIYKGTLTDAKLAPKTINEYLSIASSMMSWAEQHGYIDKNYFNGLTLKNRRKSKKGKHFTKEQLQKLFNYPAQFKAPYQYWLPLLGIYTGARLEELGQLYLDDIKRVDETWVFEISEGDDKHIKTSASSRVVPIHHHLIQLGILDYKNKLELHKHKRLFLELKKIKNRYTHYASRWFGDFTIRQGVRESKTRGGVFHSFRHTVANVLKQQGFPKEQVAGLLGHESDEGFTFSRYDDTYGIPC